MGLETGTYISDLLPQNPPATDPRSQGADHLRLIKAVLKNTFPSLKGAVTLDQDTLNALPTSKQDALGYTPVQQGGGSYQDGTQKVYLGAYTRFGTTPGLQIGDTDYGVLVSGTLYSALNSGDLPIYSFHCTAAGIPGCWYGPSTDKTTWLPLARQVDVTAVSDALPNYVSGVNGVNASAGDKPGTALYFAGALVKPFFQYDGGNGALAWENDVLSVNSSLANAVANQANINAGFSADISDCVSGTVGMSQSGDIQMRGLCMRYSSLNGGCYPYATYKDGGGTALVQSNAGTGFSIIYNAKMQYVSESEGYLWVDYVGGGSAKFVSADCGVIAASLDSNGYGIARGTWTLTGNILDMTFTVIGKGQTAVSFPKEFAEIPDVLLTINAESGGVSRACNINTHSDGSPNLSAKGFSFQPVYIADGGGGTSGSLFYVTVHAKGIAA